MSLFLESSATFSPCRRYRYTLTRRWNPDGPIINFVMLNPSTADETQNDPTVERCQRRAQIWNYGGLIVTNLFAWRATDPAELKRAEDPIGPDNNDAIVQAAHGSQLIVCAWGNYGTYLSRGEFVRKRLHQFATLHYLKLSSKTGQPFHPLYLSYTLRPMPWNLTGESR